MEFLTDQSLYTSLLPREVKMLIMGYLEKFAYFYGLNNDGQLGLGDTDDRLQFTKNPMIFNDLQVSENFSLMLVDHHLYLAGKALTSQQDIRILGYFTSLGRKIDQQKIDTYTVFTPISEIAYLKPYTFDPSSDAFVPISGVFNPKINKISVSTSHFAFITVDKELYMFGNPIYGILGIHINKYIGHKLYHVLNNVDDVKCGSQHTLILSQGKVYGCGNNGHGQLSLSDETSTYDFTEITGFDSPVTNIFAKHINSAVITEQGTCYVFGANGYTQLGTNEGSFIRVPKILPLDVDDTPIINIKKICFGSYHTLILTYDGILYGSGYNISGQLGLGPDIKAIARFQVIVDFGFVEDCDAGRKSSMIIVNGDVYVAGSSSIYDDKQYFTSITRQYNGEVFIRPNLNFTQVVCYDNTAAIITNEFQYY